MSLSVLPVCFLGFLKLMLPQATGGSASARSAEIEARYSKASVRILNNNGGLVHILRAF